MQVDAQGVWTVGSVDAEDDVREPSHEPESDRLDRELGESAYRQGAEPPDLACPGECLPGPHDETVPPPGVWRRKRRDLAVFYARRLGLGLRWEGWYCP